MSGQELLFGGDPFVPVRLVHTSSVYERLAFDPGEAAQGIRETLERWWAEMPKAARQQVRKRFQSTDLAEHLGAFWEIYLHAALLRLFGAVAVDIGEDHLSRRRPDFALEGAGGGALIEATAVAGEDFVERRDRLRVQQLYDLIERSRNRMFLLHLRLFAVGPNTPGRRFLVEIERWLDALDYEAELRRKRRREPGPRRTFKRDDWSLEVGASPWLPHLLGRQDLRLIGSREEGFEGGEGFRAMDEAAPLRRALRRKAAHRYELAERPFVIATLCAGELVEERDIAMALLGEIKYRLGGSGAYVGGGLWLGEDQQPRNRNVSAVLTAVNLRPSSAAQVEPTLWTNPWARQPIPPTLFPWRRMAIQDDGQIRECPAVRDAAHILGLNRRWPQPV